MYHLPSFAPSTVVTPSLRLSDLYSIDRVEVAAQLLHSTGSAAQPARGMLQTGQLTYSQFQQGLQLFAQWWQSATSVAAGDGPCWRIKTVTLPVIEQVVLYAELERVLMPAALAEVTGTGVMQQAPQPTAAAAATKQGSAAPVRALPAAVAGAVDPDEGIYESLDDGDDACIACSAHGHSGLQSSLSLLSSTSAAAVLAPWQVHIHQYSIVRHESYQVPVLYIRAFKPDGICLGLDELMQDLPGLQNSKEPGQADWPYVTAVEHPLLRTPCYMLHPCQIADRMTLMMQHAHTATAEPASVGLGSDSSSKGSDGSPAGAAAAALRGAAADGDVQLLHYMQCWFSLVAGVIGFSMVNCRFV